MKKRALHILNQDDPGLGHRDSYIPGMETVIATTSGYRGREKAKLIELIIETGATYTGSLTKSNTHVVCWDFEGPRFALAKKLRLTIVNHRWFEECLQEGRHLTESPYIMCCGREVGPLLWEPPARAEVTRQKRRPLSDDEAFVTSDSSIPILYRESPLKMQEICFKSPKIAARSSYNNNEEDDRSISRRRDNQVHNKQPLQDLINKSYSQKAQIEDRNCSSSKQNMEKQRRKTRRLVKKSDYGSILNYVTPFEDDTGEPIGTCNVGEDKEKSDFKNSGIVPEPSHKFCPPEVGIEVVYCTSTGSRKNSIEGKTCESTVDMDIDIEDVGKPLSPTPSDHSISNEVACPICLTEASESRGILPCGHHFCLECIMKWSKILVSQKKKPPCPVCKEIFGFIFKNHADCHDQKIYSQTLPEFTNNNIYIVGENALEDNLQLPGNLHCNICGSGDTEELLLKCHRCGRRAAHTFCLDPPLPPVSDVPWTCAPCISGRRLVYEFP